MPISQTEGYFENPWYRLLEEPVLFLLAWKWNFWEKAFSIVKSKDNLNFAVNLLKGANTIFTVYLVNHIFQTSALKMIVSNLIDCVNIWKRSEAANQPLLYWIEWNTSLSLWVSLNEKIKEKRPREKKNLLLYWWLNSHKD